MKLIGKIKCENCNTELEWEYIVPQHVFSNRFVVEKINTKIYSANKISRNEDNIYTLSIVCNKYRKRNIFKSNN
mgnify:CR=1 FL=1